MPRPKQQEHYRTPTWSQLIRKRDNYTCQRCGRNDVPVLAHHIVRWQDDESRWYDPKNGQTLCWPCHSAVHVEMRIADPSMGWGDPGYLRQYHRHRNHPIPQEQLH